MGSGGGIDSQDTMFCRFDASGQSAISTGDRVEVVVVVYDAAKFSHLAGGGIKLGQKRTGA